MKFIAGKISLKSNVLHKLTTSNINLTFISILLLMMVQLQCTNAKHYYNSNFHSIGESSPVGSVNLNSNANNNINVNNHVYSYNQRFAMEPQDQTAVVGSRVTLPCRVVNKQGLLQWTKDDFGLGTHRNLSGFERYSMIGSDEEGDYSLDIYPVMLDDDARYQCQVSGGPEGQPAVRSEFARLIVLVPPEQPKILQGDHILTTEDRRTEIECISVGGKPPAEINWIDGNGNVITENIEYTVQPLQDMRRFTAKSILYLTPKQEHHKTNITCQAQNTADRTYRSAKIRLEIKYAPKVKVNIIGGALAGGRLPEFAQVRLECKADANPTDLRYRWFINDEPIIGGHKTEMVIRNVTRKFHDSIVKCEVQNSVGKSEDSETLDVSYGPQFKQKPKSIEADIGTPASLNCEVDGNPQPDVVWIQHPIDRVVGITSNLTFIVTNETAGRYYCKASVPGYSEISSDASVYVKGSPIVTSNRFQYGLIGDTARIECHAISVPKARHVSWTFNGHEINSESGGSNDYSILIDTVPGGVRSTLIIRDSQAYHYGKYNCTVVNDYGNDVAEIQLQAQKSVPLLMTIVGGISSVAILMILTIIVLIYFKCKKKELPQADVISEHQITKLGGGHQNHHHSMSGMGMKEAGDRTSNYSDLKVDISAGYVPYADYTTHYSPPPQYLTTIQTNNPHMNGKSSSVGIITAGKNSNGTNSNTNSLHHHHHHNHPQQQHHQHQLQQQHHTLVPMTFMNGGSLTGSVMGSRDILRQDNGLPSLQSTCTTVTTSLGGSLSGGGSSVVSSSPNGSTSNSINTHLHPQHQHQYSAGSGSLTVIDPRYSAIYGNPYLRNSNSSLLPPPTAV